eukprot:SAG11_NODE_1591_length_4618_cov_3.431069_4_plen_64_part_00
MPRSFHLERDGGSGGGGGGGGGGLFVLRGRAPYVLAVSALGTCAVRFKDYRCFTSNRMGTNDM